jgi:hypothetical protein
MLVGFYPTVSALTLKITVLLNNYSGAGLLSVAVVVITYFTKLVK